MVVRFKTQPVFASLGDVVKQLAVSPDRIRLDPRPGTVTVRDYVRILNRERRLYELIDGTLVEKVLGAPEPRITNKLIRKIEEYVEDNDLGYTLGTDGPIRILPGLVRMPDLSFISWEKRPDRSYPTDPVSKEIPDLAVEVISPGNRRQELKRKLNEYFLAGVRLVWLVHPKRRKVQVHTAPDEMVELTQKQCLDGGDVLPGFSLELRYLFATTPERPAQ